MINIYPCGRGQSWRREVYIDSLANEKEGITPIWLKTWKSGRPWRPTAPPPPKWNWRPKIWQSLFLLNLLSLFSNFFVHIFVYYYAKRECVLSDALSAIASTPSHTNQWSTKVQLFFPVFIGSRWSCHFSFVYLETSFYELSQGIALNVCVEFESMEKNEMTPKRRRRSHTDQLQRKNVIW